MARWAAKLASDTWESEGADVQTIPDIVEEH